MQNEKLKVKNVGEMADCCCAEETVSVGWGWRDCTGDGVVWLFAAAG
jgi:hypothetical protein